MNSWPDIRHYAVLSILDLLGDNIYTILTFVLIVRRGVRECAVFV